MEMTFVNKDVSFHIAAKSKEVYDVSGAGDTVIASLCYGLSQLNLNLEESNYLNGYINMVKPILCKCQIYLKNLECF